MERDDGSYNSNLICIIRPVGAKDAGDAGGPPWHPHILTDQLTLSQPGGQIKQTTKLLPPPNFQAFLQPWIHWRIEPKRIYRDRNRRYATGHQKSVSFFPLIFSNSNFANQSILFILLYSLYLYRRKSDNQTFISLMICPTQNCFTFPNSLFCSQNSTSNVFWPQWPQKQLCQIPIWK